MECNKQLQGHDVYENGGCVSHRAVKEQFSGLNVNNELRYVTV